MDVRSDYVKESLTEAKELVTGRIIFFGMERFEHRHAAVPVPRAGRTSQSFQGIVFLPAHRIRPGRVNPPE